MGNLNTWLLIILGLFLGMFFQNLWHRFSRQTEKMIIPTKSASLALDKNVKVVLTLIVLFLLSVATWVFKYYAEKSGVNQFLTEVLSAIFSVTSAAFLGGVVFEFLLRKDILNEVSHTLADIITTDKTVVKEIFTHEKRNKIVETMLQVQLNSDLYGSAIYSDFLSHYLQPGNSVKQFRFDFSDHITLSKIEKSQPELSRSYLEIIDRIGFKTVLPNLEKFIFGCARDESGLYDFFNDTNCIYRWLLKDDAFDQIIESGYGFNAKLFINGVLCETIKQGEISKRGFELQFVNHLYDERGKTSTEKIVEVNFEVSTLQLLSQRAVTVHLAYPVKGVEVSLDYDNTNIQQVTYLHFMTAGENKPRITEGVNPKFSKQKRTMAVNISNDHWLFPDSGVVFYW